MVSNDATVTITVMCKRAPPNAEDVPEETDENTPICVDVLDNDSDPEGDELTVDSIIYVGTPDRGTATKKEGCDGIEYTPDPDLCNEELYGQSQYTATFEYTIRDADDSLTDTATVTVVVECVIPPIAEDDGPFPVNEEETIDIPVTNNDYDPDGGVVEINEITDEPDYGTVTPLGPNDIKYTPDPTICDEIAPEPTIEDTFEYNVVDSNDDELVSNDATVTVIIECNRGPIYATPDERTTNEDVPIPSVPVLDNDVDSENEPLTLTGIDQPNKGTATQNPDGTITYEPELCNDYERNAGQYVVVIPYRIEDSDDKATASSTYTVTVICNQPPTPSPDYAETTEDKPVEIPVLGNDNDPENDPLTIEDITRQPNEGSATEDGTTITYTPDKKDCDAVAPQPSYTTTLEYNIRDGSTASLVSPTSATVTIKVNCLRGQPIANPDAEETDEDTPVDVYPLTNDEDPEEQPLTLLPETVGQPSIGDIVVDGDKVTYTPGEDGDRKCRELAGTYPSFDGYIVRSSIYNSRF